MEMYIILNYRFKSLDRYCFRCQNLKKRFYETKVMTVQGEGKIVIFAGKMYTLQPIIVQYLSCHHSFRSTYTIALIVD